MLSSNAYTACLLAAVLMTHTCAQTSESPASPQSHHLFLEPPNPAAAVIPKPHVALDPERSYTLAELIDIAEREHPETRIAWESTRNAALATGIAESTYLPRITANVIGGYQASSGSSSILGFTSSGSASTGGTVSALSLEWLLFDFGGRRNVVDASRKLQLVSNIAFTGVHQKIIHDVCLAYYAYLAAVRRVTTTQATLMNAQQIEAAARQRYQRGVGTILETSQAAQTSAQAQFASLQAKIVERDAYASLIGVMGVSPLANIKIAANPDHALNREMRVAIDTVVKDALSRRPDVLGAYAAKQASQAAVRAAEAQYRPKIFVAGTGAYVSGQIGLTAIPAIGEQLPTLNISGNHWNSTLLVGLSISVFDAHAKANAISQARNNAARAADTLDRVRLDAVREIVLAQNAVNNSLAAIDAARALVGASQTAYDAGVESYKHDVGTITDVIAIQTQLLQANLALDDAYSSALSSAATLAFATGALGGAPRE